MIQTLGKRRRHILSYCLLWLTPCLLLMGCVPSSLSSAQGQDKGFLQSRLDPLLNYVPFQGSKVNPDTATSELEKGKEFFRLGKYREAEEVFGGIADNKKVPILLAEEARYYQAESLRAQLNYPRAADTYKLLLKEFPSRAFHQQSIQRMFEIANYWLDDTRAQMEAREKETGMKWSFLPTNFVHFEKSKPLLDIEGRALELLDQVYLNDPVGPLGERSLFYIGSVKFFREQYGSADYYFNQVVQNYKNGELAPKALELSILCKQLSTRSADYDGRKTAEARELIHLAKHAYPGFAQNRGEFLQRQLAAVNMQQAEKDYKVAEFYRRSGHPGAAFFYYEIVKRRYPGTKFATEASEKMQLVRAAAEAEKAGTGGLWSRLYPKKQEPNDPQRPAPEAPPSKETPPSGPPPQPGADVTPLKPDSQYRPGYTIPGKLGPELMPEPRYIQPPTPIGPAQNYMQPPQGYPPQGYPPQGYPPQGYPPQGYPPQGYPPQGYPPQGYPPQGAYPYPYPYPTTLGQPILQQTGGAGLGTPVPLR